MPETDNLDGLSAALVKFEKELKSRYFELLEQEGDRILQDVQEARRQGDENRVKQLQNEARIEAGTLAMVELGVIEPRTTKNTAIPSHIPPFGEDV